MLKEVGIIVVISGLASVAMFFAQLVTDNNVVFVFLVVSASLFVHSFVSRKGKSQRSKGKNIKGIFS